MSLLSEIRPTLKDAKKVYVAVDKHLAENPTYQMIKEKLDPTVSMDVLWICRDLFLEGYFIGSQETQDYHTALEDRRLAKLKKEHNEI
jgi:hypothetical protein